MQVDRLNTEICTAYVQTSAREVRKGWILRWCHKLTSDLDEKLERRQTIGRHTVLVCAVGTIPPKGSPETDEPDHRELSATRKVCGVRS